MCVSYRGLNKVNKIYEYLIPWCDMAVTIFEIISSKMWIITVDDKQGYHQISVRKCDIENLVFFAPDSKMYEFTVMPFGPVNEPAFYSCMMGTFKDECDTLLLQTITPLAAAGIKLDGETIRIVGYIITIGTLTLHSGTKSISMIFSSGQIKSLLSWYTSSVSVKYFRNTVLVSG